MLPPVPCWRYHADGVEVRFVGKTPGDVGSEITTVLDALDESPEAVGWLRQQHSAEVRAALEGPCGSGDGLWTTRPGLALCVVTADCVPVVCAARGRLAVIHAGWRGLEAGVIAATLRALPEPARDLEAWLGPAIGPCCYEVGEDVADRVCSASSESILIVKDPGRPRLDLHRAAEIQLLELGIERVRRVEECTKCHSDRLWSYRGSPGSRGRNLTLAWLA
ncbi:MAG: peptidoglycan editing factor PgeF [Thermoanaerobaculia bacterium]